MSRLIDADVLRETIVPLTGMWDGDSFWISYSAVLRIIDSAEPTMEISCEEDGPMLVYLPEGWQRDPIAKIILFYDDGKSVEYSEERYDMKQRGDNHEA